VRFFFSLLLVVLVISSGVGVVMFSAAEQGTLTINLASVPLLERIEQSHYAREIMAKVKSLSLPWQSSPAEASAAPVSPAPVQQAAAVPPPVTILPGQPIGDWTLNCGVNPQTLKKQCTIAQQLKDEKSKSVVFAWLIGNDGDGNLVAIWQTPTGVLVNKGVVVDIGSVTPTAVPYTSCVNARCEAIASLDPNFVQALTKATKATATIYTVSGQDLTFTLSVNGLAEAIDAVKAPTAS